jgi:undecaprenyl-diphosphatase
VVIWKIVVLAAVQGIAELLPVSSSAHVVVAEKLMGLDPAAPPMTLLLVMLHTGTMLAVVIYFWNRWRQSFFGSSAMVKRTVVLLTLATGVTGIVGEALVVAIEKSFSSGGDIEQLFGRLDVIAPALAVAGLLILISGLRDRPPSNRTEADIGTGNATWIGAVQALCLPFRGFSRSGATISTGLLLGVAKVRAEEFSFALAVILTPPVIAREVLRLARHSAPADLASVAMPSLVGAVCAFLAGLIALRWLGRWLESGRWYLFGAYCLVAATGVEVLSHFGY